MNWTSISTVALVTLLIILLVTSFASLFLPALYQHSITAFWTVTPLCITSVLIGCYSYFRAVFTSPGYTQPSQKSHYSPTQIDQMKSRHSQQLQFKRLLKQNTLNSQIKKRQIQNLTQNSYCAKCDNVKLSRTHHCKICRQCVQRMDHHCPWVGNCVGKHNHKFFILFLLYITVALLLVSVCIVVDYLNPQQPVFTQIYQQDQIYFIVVLVTGGMCILLTLSIGFLLVGQVMLIAYNLTTLESFYDDIYSNVFFCQKKNPFDKQSFTLHVKQIMGESLWLLPTKPFPGNHPYINAAFTEE